MIHVGDLGRVGGVHACGDGVAVEIEGVGAGILHGQGVAGDKRTVYPLVIVAVVAEYGRLSGRVGEYHVAERLAEASVAVIEERVAREGVAALHVDLRPLVEVGYSGAGVVISRCGIDFPVLARDECLAHELRYGSIGVVGERVGIHLERVVLVGPCELDVEIEERVLGRRVIETLLRGQGVGLVVKLSSHHVVAHILGHVVEKHRSGESDVAVDEPHVSAGIGAQLGHFGGAVIVELVAVDKECVALLHPHVAVGLERR